MTLTIFTLIADCVSLFLVFLSLVFVAGIVWRVERRLDRSYKFFLAALVFLLLSESTEKFFSDGAFLAAASSLFGALFALFLFLGTGTMRSIVRELDGETPAKNQVEKA